MNKELLLMITIHPWKQKKGKKTIKLVKERFE